MKHFHTHIVCLAGIAAALGFVMDLHAQTSSTPTAAEIGKALGFAEADIPRIKAGEILTREQKEGSDKELAGVLVALFKKPVGELAEIALEGKLLKTDPSIRAVHDWAPDASAEEAFATVALDAKESNEAALYTRASAGGKLNLSAEEIERFKKLKPDHVNAELRAMLQARHEAYRKSGLKGIAPYARGGKNVASPSEELALAIRETMVAARKPDYFEALLNFPAKPLAGMEHRFYWFKMEVEKRPTFVLAHRASLRGEKAALLTEEQYYVSHSYNSNFVAGGCLAVEGGTLVFYVNRTFTDQVAGLGSGMKHGIGRKQMLSEVAANLKRIRQELQK